MTRQCYKCRSEISESANFCPTCGWDQRKGAPLVIRLSPKNILIVVVAAGAVWGAAWQTSTSLAGTKPTKQFEESTFGAKGDSKAPSSPEIEKLRSAAETNPNSSEGWKALASALVSKIQSSGGGSQPEILDLIDVLGKILKIEPKDKEALLIMGDLSFEQRVFDKAAQYYKRFLDEAPDEVSARSRYASALTFVGNFKEAEEELHTVLKKDPNNFTALTYLTVTYAQQGNKDKALETGADALAKAPQGEARDALAGFIERVKKGEFPLKGGPVRGNVPPAATPEQKAPTSGAPADLLAAYLQGNPIAGPKFAKAEAKGDEIRVYFNNFPMSAMPPFAKDKFFGGIRALTQKGGFSGIKKIVFVDNGSGETLDTLGIP